MKYLIASMIMLTLQNYPPSFIPHTSTAGAASPMSIGAFILALCLAHMGTAQFDSSVVLDYAEYESLAAFASSLECYSTSINASGAVTSDVLSFPFDELTATMSTRAHAHTSLTSERVRAIKADIHLL